MKSPPFDYARPRTLEEAFALMERYGESAQILAGGQSLVLAMNLRVNAPAVLIDINRISALTGIEDVGRTVRIGALARHAEVKASEIVTAELPLIAEALNHVAHPAIRNRGTFGGSIALADPAAELPACAVALNAEIVLAKRGRRRVVAADQFFRGLFETDRQRDEIVIEVLIPKRGPDDRNVFMELSRRRGDFAVVGVACHAEIHEQRIEDMRLVVFGCEPFPKIARAAVAAVVGRSLDPPTIDGALAALNEDLTSLADLNGDENVKRHLAQVLVRRAMNALTEPNR